MERPMEQVRHSVVALNSLTAWTVDTKSDDGFNCRKILSFDYVEEGFVIFCGITHAPQVCTAGNRTSVSNLTAHFRVENGLVQSDHRPSLISIGILNFSAALKQVVADELRRDDDLCPPRDTLGNGDDLLLLRGTGACTLLLHKHLESRHIDG